MVFDSKYSFPKESMVENSRVYTFLNEAKSGSEKVFKKMISLIKLVPERKVTVLGTIKVLLDCCVMFWNFAVDLKIRYAMNNNSVNEFFEATNAFNLFIKDKEIGEWNAKILRGFVCVAEALFHAKTFKSNQLQRKCMKLKLNITKTFHQLCQALVGMSLVFYTANHNLKLGKSVYNRPTIAVFQEDFMKRFLICLEMLTRILENSLSVRYSLW